MSHFNGPSDRIVLPNTGTTIEVGEDNEGKGVIVIELLKKAAASAATRSGATRANNLTESVEKAQANPTDTKAQDEAKDAVKQAVDEGFVSQKDFDEYVKKTDKTLEEHNGWMKSMWETLEEHNGWMTSMWDVLPKDKEGHLIVIDKHLRQFVAGVRDINPSHLRFVFARFLAVFFAAWIVSAIVFSFIFGWGLFNNVVLGMLVGAILGFGFGFKNEHPDHDHN